jgi:hypothetical protein
MQLVLEKRFEPSDTDTPFFLNKSRILAVPAQIPHRFPPNLMKKT